MKRIKIILVLLILIPFFLGLFACSKKNEQQQNINTENLQQHQEQEKTEEEFAISHENDKDSNSSFDNYIGIYTFESVEDIIGTYKIHNEERIMENKNWKTQWVLPKTNDMYIEIKLNEYGRLVMELHIDYYVIPNKNIFVIDLPLYNDTRLLGFASQNETDCYYYFGEKIIREYEVWKGDKFRMVFIKK
jgi:hypothetical protein